ncbi:MAG TPA: TIM-barrel domain-containing protein [Actinomycetales bacterium]|nr:TIM-barrel domain-containing protein [Actinomycetales bacterium]
MVTLSSSGLDAAADPRAVVQGPGYRFTVLTSRLLRMEWDDRDRFVDLPTQLVVSRAFPVPEFTVHDTGTTVDIWTDHLHLTYVKGRFSRAGLSVSLRRRAQPGHRTTWHYDDPPDDRGGWHGNLGGTLRTLDDVDGEAELEPGLLAPYGYAVISDSGSVQLTEDGWFAPRADDPEQAGEDLYFFGYGRDYQAALRDYFRLTGPNPLLPRWALGNWWSRYHRYTADEYLALMDRFAAERIPFSVAVLDMDWHLVDIDPEIGSGWTGYTWDTGLFPDPPAFLRALHERRLAVALNVHPADGVRRHEQAYPDVARDLGLDPATGLEVAFDITSREFTDSYLKRLHHPHEEAGVDLWWLDWQSGGVTRVPGLDPLWMLNHVHYIDSGRDGRRPLTFSRYAGLGSHRYPVGFSGDTIATWASLAFQPYFTATAANVGYFWWSHDIGGHLGGAKDPELATRWYQLGTFSPINRLHSSNSPFNSKEPWRFGVEAERIMARYLRLRHELVPYVYSASWVAHTDGVAVVRPMYHDHPQAEDAYEVPNQYMFGPDLLVAPITSPADRQTRLAQVTAWLPDGVWFDVFTGRRYDGGRSLVLHRPLELVPVLARAGSVVPLLADPMTDPSDNPDSLLLQVFPSASGRADLYEDDGKGTPTVQQRHRITFDVRWHGDDAVLSIPPPKGPGVRTERSLTLALVGVASVRQVRVSGGVRQRDVTHRTTTPAAVRVQLGRLELAGGVEVTLRGVRLSGEDVPATAFALLDRAEIAYTTKERALDAVTTLTGPALIAALHAIDLPGNLFGALLELVSARR